MNPDSPTIAAAIASTFAGVTPPAGEDAIVLATHLLPDELKLAELPALLVWPPVEEVVLQPGLDRSRFTYPSILYVPRGTRTTQARIAALYAWRDVLRTRIQEIHSHLGLSGVAEANSQRVLVNAPEDVTYGLVNYDTVRVEVFVRIYQPGTWQP